MMQVDALAYQIKISSRARRRVQVSSAWSLNPQNLPP
jgi:hypothetical protein